MSMARRRLQIENLRTIFDKLKAEDSASGRACTIWAKEMLGHDGEEPWTDATPMTLA